MSLVAYDVESDNDSNSEEEQDQTINNKALNATKQNDKQYTTNSDEEFEVGEEVLETRTNGTTFAHLPPPKKPQINAKELQEEKDDEFLHKTPNNLSQKVKITIPSLRDFKDIDMKYKDLHGNPDGPIKRPVATEPKGSKLLNILPPAKSEQNFLKSTAITSKTNHTATVIKPSFVPDSVRLGRAALNTEETIGNVRAKKAEKRKLPAKTVDVDENEDVETADFFSLNDKTTDNLPDVNSIDVNAMLAERTAKLADKYAQPATDTNIEMSDEQLAAQRYENNVQNDEALDAEALQKLAGRKAAKRARQGEETVEIMEINSGEILPSREEWIRTALAASTGYQPTGVLTDEEPAAGTRRKHQITYLAHKAKANEAELQAMWAANRQTRRATQSKYGF